MFKFFLPFALVLLLAACSVPSQGGNQSGNTNTSAVSIPIESASTGDGQKTKIWLTNFFN